MDANKPRIVAFTGKAGCGKGEAAAALVATGYELRKFATPMKDMLCFLLLHGGIVFDEMPRYIEGDLKEVPLDCLGGKTPRYAMQTLGTEWGRVTFGDDFWVNLLVNSLRPGGLYVIDDLRFDNEAEAVREAGGVVVEVSRGELARDAGSHASEAGISPELVDLTIFNNKSLDALRSTTVALLTPA